MYGGVAIRVVLDLGDGAGGGEGGGVGGGVGVGNCSSGLGGSRKISRAWKCLLLWRISILGGAFEHERARKKKKRGVCVKGFKRFRSHIILEYTPAMRIFATLCVILRSRVLIKYVGACYTRGAGSRRSCGVWGRRGRWRGGGGMNESYVMDG